MLRTVASCCSAALFLAACNDSEGPSGAGDASPSTGGASVPWQGTTGGAGGNGGRSLGGADSTGGRSSGGAVSTGGASAGGSATSGGAGGTTASGGGSTGAGGSTLKEPQGEVWKCWGRACPGGACSDSPIFRDPPCPGSTDAGYQLCEPGATGKHCVSIGDSEDWSPTWHVTCVDGKATYRVCGSCGGVIGEDAECSSP